MTVTCPSCGREYESGRACSCGSRARVRKVGDIGKQITHTKRTVKAGWVFSGGKLRRGGE